MAKKSYIFETLNSVKSIKKTVDEDGLMTLSGVFGVCGVRNNNQRVYEANNYSKMVTEMQSRIKKNGGIPGELEHPQTMNITLENVSHKITDINIDENGVITGTIKLLNTPKGQIAQAIVEGGLNLFISSRATGNVDQNTGNVTLEKISTYDLVGSPGFSQAELHLNENQTVNSLNESIYYISENTEDGVNEKNEIMHNEELSERLEKVESLLEQYSKRIEDLEATNEELQEQLDSKPDINLESLANSIQKWIVEEYSAELEKWIVEEFGNEMKSKLLAEAKDDFIQNIAPGIQKWIVEEYSAELEKWIVEEYSGEVQNWCVEELAQGIQNWIVEEYSNEVDNWMNESFKNSVQNMISENIKEYKNNSSDMIESTLAMLENISNEPHKPTLGSTRVNLINEAAIDEPVFLREMPADARVKWNMATTEIKESITRRAKLYNFGKEGSVQRFWESIDFDSIKPTQEYKGLNEGLENIANERERQIRAAFRRHQRNLF